MARKVRNDADPTRLRELCERLQWSRLNAGHEDATEFARAHGIPPPTYLSHENGSRGFKRDTAARYAALFKVDLTWLVTGKGHPRHGTLGNMIDGLPGEMQDKIQEYVQFIASQQRSR